MTETPGPAKDDLPEGTTLSGRIRRALVGKPKKVRDPKVFHHLSLVAFLAWVGLGADGLSSSSYGPAEAYDELVKNGAAYLAPFLAVMIALTVFVISAAYTRVIEEFPEGGGGYVVASKLLGPRVGVVSGCALLVDYILTITVSIAAAGDALFSFLPEEWRAWKLAAEVFFVVLLTMMNIRGVKESVIPLTPVFILFLVTHAILIVGGFVTRADHIDDVARETTAGVSSGLQTLGLLALVKTFFHAYSLGGGTFTGIEAVSNGLTIMRQPRVETGRRTMRYMSISLALTAAGLLVAYMLWDVDPEKGKTLNAVLAERFAGDSAGGRAFVIATLLSEATLLVVAAQAGFLDGPRVLASMARDSWVPRRFASLSERLTTHYGILLMAGAALAALLLAAMHDAERIVKTLVVMYSINVFVTFSLSMFAMARLWWRERAVRSNARQRLVLFVAGFVLCSTILTITVVEKFDQGAWITLLVTGLVVALCFAVRIHYRNVAVKLHHLYKSLEQLPPDQAPGPLQPIDPKAPMAAIFVANWGGVGVHTLLNVLKSFPANATNVVFLSVGVVDSGAFKGEAEIEALQRKTEDTLKRYVRTANELGRAAIYRFAIGTDAVDEAAKLGQEVAKEFPKTTFFAGYVLFRNERWITRLLHNETAFAIQRRMQWHGHPLVIVPARLD